MHNERVSGPSLFRTPTRGLRVAVVASDRLTRKKLTHVLEEHGHAAVAPEDEADVAIVDARRRRMPSLDVPILALVDDDARPAELLAAGASAVLRRDAEAAHLSAALIAIHHGLVVVDGGLARASLPEADDLAAPPEPLSARERQVLNLIATGLSNRRIAERLGISPHTAKFFVSSILRKLGVETRAEAVAAAARCGLIWL